MSKRSDDEFEILIHSDETHVDLLESDDAKHLRDELEPGHATETGELPTEPEVA